MNKRTIVVLEGDGIGPEIMREGLKVLAAISQKYGHKFKLIKSPYGAQAYFDNGDCYPPQTKYLCQDVADAVLKGPIGLGLEGTKRLNAAGVKLENDALLPLRADLDTYACYRPVVLPRSCADFSPLKSEVIGEGIDILMLRELVGGIYFGRKVEGFEKGQFTREDSSDDCSYTFEQVRRFAHVCFKEAKKRNSRLVNVQKPNILATGRFWNAVFEDMSKKEYPDVYYSSMIVDNVAYQLMVNPRQFNGVMALENMQGDILTDQAGGILGSLGLMPSACLNPETGKGYYEPSHGSAPDIAGKNTANPYSMIGSVALMLGKSFGLEREEQAIWASLTQVFSKGYRTRELVKSTTSLEKVVTTSQFGDLIVENILSA